MKGEIMTQKMKEYKECTEELLYSCTCRNTTETCKETMRLIGRNDISRLEKIIESEEFNPNERFDSAHVAGENYINYALNNSKYEIARILAKKHTIKLNSDDKERMLLQLLMERKFLFLYRLIQTIENKRINIVKFLKGIIKQDYESIVEEPVRRLKSNA